MGKPLFFCFYFVLPASVYPENETAFSLSRRILLLAIRR